MTIGTGTAITFSSGFFAAIDNIDWSGMSREAVNTSHMGTTGALTFEPTSLDDPGELSVDLHFASGTTPPITGAVETCTITFANGDTWVAQAFLTEFEFTDPFEDKMTARATLKFSGTVVVTAA